MAKNQSTAWLGASPKTAGVERKWVAALACKDELKHGIIQFKVTRNGIE
jgi:hypothetical protein